MEDVKIREFDYWYTQIRDRLVAQHGEQITLKTLQKILHFSSNDALVAAINSKYIEVEMTTLTDGSYTRIKTDSAAKYIVNQYIRAIQYQHDMKK